MGLTLIFAPMSATITMTEPFGQWTLRAIPVCWQRRQRLADTARGGK
jgi:hypothetical protein